MYLAFLQGLARVYKVTTACTEWQYRLWSSHLDTKLP